MYFATWPHDNHPSATWRHDNQVLCYLAACQSCNMLPGFMTIMYSVTWSHDNNVLFAIKENSPPFQELETQVAKLSLSGSMCVSAYQLQFPHLSLSQETLQSMRISKASDKHDQIIIIWQSVCVCISWWKLEEGGIGKWIYILGLCESGACFISVQKLDDVTQPWEGKC